MKRSFLAACVLLLGTYASDSQDISTLTSKPAFQQTTIAGVTYDTSFAAMESTGAVITVIGVDDLAVVGTVLGIASSLKSLFTSNEGNNEEVLRKLNDLRRQNIEIIKLLGKVVDVLGKLDVIISEAVRQQFLLDLQATIAATTQQYYETRLAVIADPSYAPTAKARFESQYESLSTLNRKQIYYGFGAFQTVGATMMFELDLATRLRRQKVEQIEALKTYQAYFKRVLDPNEPNSIGASQKYLREVVGAANAILAAADQSLSNNRRYDRGEYCRYDTFECECGGYRLCTRTISTINGNRTAGYSVSNEQTSRTIGSCRRCPIGPRTSVSPRSVREVSAALAAARELPPVPTAPTDSTPEGLTGSWNQTRSIETEATQQLAAVDKASANAQLFLDEVERRLRQLGP